MSRLSSLSAAAIQAMFASETDEQLITLITIYDPDDNTTPVLRLCDSWTGQLSALTTDDDVAYGVTRGGEQFIYLPLQLQLPAETDTGTETCNITINYVTSEAITIIKQELTKPAKVKLELVLSSSPTITEATFEGFYITDASYNQDQIKLSLSMISYSREPFPNFNFVPSYFPGLF
jgi:hypothetical protein